MNLFYAFMGIVLFVSFVLFSPVIILIAAMFRAIASAL